MRGIFYFQESENYNFRSGSHLAFRTKLFGKEMVLNLGAKIWPLLLEELKNASSLQVALKKMEELKPRSCSHRFCKTYI